MTTLHELRHQRTQAAGKLASLEVHLKGCPTVDSTALHLVAKYPAQAEELRGQLASLDEQIAIAQDEYDAERAVIRKAAQATKPKLVKALRRLGAALDEVDAAGAEVEAHRRVVAEGYDARKIPIIVVPGVRGVVTTMAERLEMLK